MSESPIRSENEDAPDSNLYYMLKQYDDLDLILDNANTKNTIFTIPQESVIFHLKVAEQMCTSDLPQKKLLEWLSPSFTYRTRAYCTYISQLRAQELSEVEPSTEEEQLETPPQTPPQIPLCGQIKVRNPFRDDYKEWIYWQVVYWQAQQARKTAVMLNGGDEEGNPSVWELLSENGLIYIARTLKD